MPARNDTKNTTTGASTDHRLSGQYLAKSIEVTTNMNRQKPQKNVSTRRY